VEIDVDVARRVVDALCRSYNLVLHIDSTRSILAGETEISESPLTRDLERAKNEMRETLDRDGVAW
jgi:hypothetical protein